MYIRDIFCQITFSHNQGNIGMEKQGKEWHKSSNLLSFPTRKSRALKRGKIQNSI